MAQKDLERNNDFSKNVADLRPDLIDIRALDGIDFTAKSIRRDDRFHNPKRKRRSSVLATLATATDPKHIPRIEVWLEKGGRVHVLDGDHRVVNALRKIEEWTKGGNGSLETSPWHMIAASRFVGSEADAKLRAMTLNLEGGRANLNDAEVIGVVERCKNEFGMPDEEIVAQIGRGSARFITTVERILNASPELIEAAKEGKVDITTGGRIAELPLSEQGEAVEKASAALESVIDDANATEKQKQKARKSAGLAVKRRRPLTLGGIEAMLWPYWREYQAMMEGNRTKDAETMVRCGTLVRVLGFQPQDGDLPAGVAANAWDEIEKVLEPEFVKWQERQDNPPSRRAPAGQGKRRRKGSEE